MRQKGATITTTLSVKECADVFKRSALAKSSSFGRRVAKVTGMDSSGFYTPTPSPDDSPFASLDDDKPAFTVGAFVPQAYGSARGEGADLHMYVWDRGSTREAELLVSHRLGGGGHAAKVLGHVLDAFTATDRSADVTHR